MANYGHFLGTTIVNEVVDESCEFFGILSQVGGSMATKRGGERRLHHGPFLFSCGVRQCRYPLAGQQTITQTTEDNDFDEASDTAALKGHLVLPPLVEPACEAPRPRVAGHHVRPWNAQSDHVTHTSTELRHGRVRAPRPRLISPGAMGASVVGLHVHSQETSACELLVDAEVLKGLVNVRRGDLVVIESSDESLASGMPRSSGKLFLAVQEKSFETPIPQGAAISVLQAVANLFGLKARSQVTLAAVEDPRIAELDFVELSIKDQYISRADIWQLQRGLAGTCVHSGKLVSHGGLRLVVQRLTRKEPCLCGLLSERTKVVLRSRSQHFVVLVHMSREMAQWADDGALYSEKAVGFMQRLLSEWEHRGVTHALTLVLFGRVRPGPGPGPGSTSGHADCYKVVYERYSPGSGGSWEEVVLGRLKQELHRFATCLDWKEPLLEDAWSEGDALRKADESYLSLAMDGCLMEALNLALDTLGDPHINRELTKTGQQVVVVTPSPAVFRTTRALLDVTAERMAVSGIGCDVVCLGRPPRHVVPLVIFDSDDSSSPPKWPGGPEAWTSPDWLNVMFTDPTSSEPGASRAVLAGLLAGEALAHKAAGVGDAVLVPLSRHETEATDWQPRAGRPYPRRSRSSSPLAPSSPAEPASDGAAHHPGINVPVLTALLVTHEGQGHTGRPQPGQGGPPPSRLHLNRSPVSPRRAPSRAPSLCLSPALLSTASPPGSIPRAALPPLTAAAADLVPSAIRLSTQGAGVGAVCTCSSGSQLPLVDGAAGWRGGGGISACSSGSQLPLAEGGAGSDARGAPPQSPFCRHPAPANRQRQGQRGVTARQWLHVVTSALYSADQRMWMSLCEPALLPLETEEVSVRELQRNTAFDIGPPYSVTTDSEDAYQGDVGRLLDEMLCQRLEEDFQLIGRPVEAPRHPHSPEANEPSGHYGSIGELGAGDSPSVLDYHLCMGHTFHLLQVEKGVIDVKIYRRKKRGPALVSREYSFFVWGARHGGYQPAEARIACHSAPEAFNWNSFDFNVIKSSPTMGQARAASAEAFGLRGHTCYRHQTYCLVSRAPAAGASRPDGGEAEGGRGSEMAADPSAPTATPMPAIQPASFLRFAADVRSKLPGLQDVHVLRGADGAEPQAGDTIAFAAVTSGPRNRHLVTVVETDSVLRHSMAFHINLKWRISSAVVVDELVSSLRRRAVVVGLRLIQVPCGRAREPNGRGMGGPFSPPYMIPCSPSGMDRVVAALCDPQGPFDFVLDLPPVMASEGARYVHRGGVALVEQVDNGFLWVSNILQGPEDSESLSMLTMFRALTVAESHGTPFHRGAPRE